MIYIWSNTIQTCSHACVLVLVIVSPNRLPQITTSFGRLSKKWTPTLCDVIVVWPWLQCQRQFVSAECNAFSFDWRNHITKDLTTDRNQTSVNAEQKATKHGCAVWGQKSLHPVIVPIMQEIRLCDVTSECRSTGFANFTCTDGCGLF